MSHFKFGLTSEFPCGYLANKKERLLIYADDTPLSPETYAILQSNGFRRSEDIAYRPHCDGCNACQSIRVIVDQFSMSRSQKRIASKCRHFEVKISHDISADYYPLFEKYINQRHQDGVMFPAQPSQLQSFVECNWMNSYFLEVYDGEKLIAVAVGDETPQALSAVYSFFDPDYSQFSLGTFVILEQVKFTIKLNKQRLYLGYYIDECAKMNYKTNFKPYEIMSNGQWLSIGT